MSDDPILKKLDETVARYVPLINGRVGLQTELRALLAEVALREHAHYYHWSDPHEADQHRQNDQCPRARAIRNGFGVEEKL